MLDRVASKGNRSRFISKAVIYYIESHGRQTMREQLKAGYEANVEESLKMALEWFPLEEEVWSGPRHTSKKR